MKKNILTSFLLLAIVVATAQQPVVVSIGGGFNSSTSGLKSKAYLGNGYNLQGNVFIPFLRKGWDGSVKGSGKFALGVVAGGTFYNSKSLMPDAATTQDIYKLYNGSLNVMSEQNGASFNKGFTLSAGLQVDFRLGQFTLSPSFSGGFFSLTQDGFVQRGTIDSKPIILTESPKTNNTGFTVIPQVRISYPLTDHLNIYTSASLLIGPKISTVTRKLVPAGGFNDKHTYEPVQLSSGTMSEKTVHNNYQALNINAGVSWSIGSSFRRLKGKVTRPGDNGMLLTTKNTDSTKNPLYNVSGMETVNPLARALPGQPIGGIIVKGGKNPGGNSINLVTNENGEITFTVNETGKYSLQITTPEPQGKSISEQGVKGNSSSTKNKRKGRTYTGGRKNENQNMLAAPGNPIGGIIVKGGKNPGPRDMLMVSNENGQVTFTVTEAGEYTLQMTTPETQGKSINEKGVKRSESAKPGSPVGGIVVKGGKNPGGNMISVTSNSNGEFELNGLEAGNYQFTLTVPDGTQGKSINEKGVKRSNDSEAARPGQSIGGIVVKGGKNPGGNMTNLTVDSNVKIQFEVLEAGDYKFIIQTPENTHQNKQKEKVIEKATSGLKDTLKTNV